MSDLILTPKLIWGDFVPEKTQATVIGEEKRGDKKIYRVKIDGRRLSDGAVEIYGIVCKKTGIKDDAPCLLVVQEFGDDADETLPLRLADMGYKVLSVDLSGNTFGKDFYTEYPESVKYANYNAEEVKKRFIIGDIKETCWYEWTSTIRYAVSFLKNNEKAQKIGVIGIGDAAISLWQATAFSKEISAAAFFLNAGWVGYKSVEKREDGSAYELSNSELKYEAGIKPQSYAGHISCPTIAVVPTNSDKFDVAVASDTLAKINKKVYTNLIYSVSGRKKVDYGCFMQSVIFFDKILKSDNGVAELPSTVGFSCEISGGELKSTVIPSGENIKEVCVFVSEGNIKSRFKRWHKDINANLSADNTYGFSYPLYYKSKTVSAFCKITYRDGYAVYSNIITKNFDEKDAKVFAKNRIVYSARISDMESEFFADENDSVCPHGIDCEQGATVQVKSGVYDLCGIYGKGGVSSFINSEKQLPTDESILMFDAFIKDGGKIGVKLITDYFGEKTEYIATADISKEVWQNIKFSRNNFKSADGKMLKDYSAVEVISFFSDGEYLINNALWI